LVDREFAEEKRWEKWKFSTAKMMPMSRGAASQQGLLYFAARFTSNQDKAENLS